MLCTTYQICGVKDGKESANRCTADFFSVILPYKNEQYQDENQTNSHSAAVSANPRHWH